MRRIATWWGRLPFLVLEPLTTSRDSSSPRCLIVLHLVPGNMLLFESTLPTASCLVTFAWFFSVSTEKRVKFMPHLVVVRDVGRGLRLGSVIFVVVVVVLTD